MTGVQTCALPICFPVTIAIWGDNTKKTINSIINCNKIKGYTIVDIELNGILYRIQREFSLRKKDDNKIHLKYSYLYKFLNDKDLSLEGMITNSNKTIELLFGDIDSFLSSSMITQNVDNDILKFDAKKTLEVIDKAFNIDYIYNLYNLFKTAINKYKDFRKIIESKKQVYEKLVSNCKIDVIDDNEIQKLNDDLLLITNDKDKLLVLFDNIKIDIKNPKNLIILETDYITLINSLDKTKIINNNDELEDLKEKYNELKFKLKDENDLLILKDAYNSTIENYFTNTKSIVKPCELSVLENEKKLLDQYFDKYNSSDHTTDVSEMEKTLVSITDEYLSLKEKEKGIIENKPVKISNCNINKDQVLTEIIKVFNDINVFKSFVSTLRISNSNDDVENSLNFINYELLLKQKRDIEETIVSNKNKLSVLENEFNLTFKKQQTITVQNKPIHKLTDIKLKTSASVSKAIKLINIDTIINQIS